MLYITNQFSNYLSKLKEEISEYKNENDLWKLTGDIKNTPANLALHLCGNLKHNIGAVLGGNGYLRNRDLEFSSKNISKELILNEIDSTIEAVIPVLMRLTVEKMNEQFPENSHGENLTNYDMIVRLALHLGYHVGQINYHRRILSS
jgi:hypothetical protein